MNEEPPFPNIDRYRLSRLSSITWEDLISAIFGLKPSKIKSFSLPENEREFIASVISDLLEWIRNDCQEGNLECADIDQDNPTFQTRAIGIWLWNINIKKWLEERGVFLLQEVLNFLFRIAFGQDYEPLKLGEDGLPHFKYYGGLKSWTWADGTRILHLLNPGKEQEICQALRAARTDHDVLFAKGFLKLKQGDKVERVRPLILLGWATLNGLFVPEEFLNDVTETALNDPEPTPAQEPEPTIKPEEPTATAVQREKENLPPCPSTVKAKKKHLRIAYIKKCVEILGKKPNLTGKELLKESELKDVITFSPLDQDEIPSEKHIIKKWISVARKQAKISSKYGIKPK